MKMIFPDARVNRSLGDWANDMNALVDSLFGASAQASGQASGQSGTSYLPPMDVREVDDQYILAIDLPGFKLDDIQIELDGDQLVIHGSRQWASENEGERYHRVERTFGEFRRGVRLPRDVQRDRIAAEYTDGVLHVELPKSQSKSACKIEIRSGNGAAKTEVEQQTETQSSN